jgi:hypothetical protein
VVLKEAEGEDFEKYAIEIRWVSMMVFVCVQNWLLPASGPVSAWLPQALAALTAAWRHLAGMAWVSGAAARPAFAHCRLQCCLCRVKFRDSEELQTLDANRQSGGERSVSTILYLIALQVGDSAGWGLAVDALWQPRPRRPAQSAHIHTSNTTPTLSTLCLLFRAAGRDCDPLPCGG